MASATPWFSNTTGFVKAIQLINSVDSSKFLRLLTRIIQKLHIEDEAVFSDEELERLQSVFDLDDKEIDSILTASSFIFEQAIYHIAKPTVLSQQLEAVQMTEEKITCFVDAWTKNGANQIDKFKKRMFAPNQLDSVKWKLNLQMAESGRSHLKSPNAILELGISSNATKILKPKKATILFTTREFDSDVRQTKDNIQVEFNHNELYAFFNELETIQSQLDALN